ncbi:MAG: carotenoid oxygenase family protein [Acidimicrobiales bacterium]|nr:carotenoid oxygenase family protein [Acidimicrobiales bacterium]
MATLTTNLFFGSGEGDHCLEVVEGRWPSDAAGWVFIVGPDKRQPGGHWFGEHGLLCRIDCTPDHGGSIRVTMRRINTPVARLRSRFPKLFRKIEFAELSPFGITNLVNTNVQPLDGRLFIGYDAGRPIEVDPATLEFVTPVGANSEWLQSAPGLLEPLVSVAAHPAPAYEEHALYFVNYAPFPGNRHPSVARWPLNGPVERWPLVGMSEFDSIHDVKASREYLVISDLPFVVEPASFRGGTRNRPNQDHTRLWILPKATLRSTTPGESVEPVEVTIPMPTGHLSVDADDDDGVVTVYLEHIPLADLMIRVSPASRVHGTGSPFDPAFEGLIATAVQPGAVGRYRIDAATGAVLDAEVAWDDRFWGQVLAAKNESSGLARQRLRYLWFAGMGFDPELLSQEWWTLYAGSGNTALVPLDELPDRPRPGALARFDLDAMKVDQVWEFDGGSFPTPPTFVPRRGASEPDDGYIVVLLHTDGDKELQVFDASDLQRGPVARATASGFNPPLLLHSCWMPERVGVRPSQYRVPLRKDLAGAVRGFPGVVRRLAAARHSL